MDFAANTERTLTAARDWFRQPQPFFCFSVVLAILEWRMIERPQDWLSMVLTNDHPIEWTLLRILVCCSFVLYNHVLIGIFATVGARAEHSYWVPTAQNSGSPGMQECWFRELQEKGHHPVPVTYANVARWWIKGMGIATKFLLWTLWKRIAIWTIKNPMRAAQVLFFIVSIALYLLFVVTLGAEAESVIKH